MDKKTVLDGYNLPNEEIEYLKAIESKLSEMLPNFDVTVPEWKIRDKYDMCVLYNYDDDAIIYAEDVEDKIAQFLGEDINKFNISTFLPRRDDPDNIVVYSFVKEKEK